MGKRNASVSLLMIVRNEERNLADCLEPVADLFDEIVIVDTGSTDATKEIAARYTQKVFDFPWCDDFSAARNESLRRASGEWVFWLDADDRIRPDNVARLRQLFGELNGQPGVYFMDTVLYGQYESESPQLLSHPRLFRCHPNVEWSYRVHEQLRPDLTTLGYETTWSDIQIDHLGYQDAKLRQRKLQRDIRLLRMDYAVDPHCPSTNFHLGLAYADLGNFAEARKHLGRLLVTEQFDWSYLERVYRVLADLSLREGDLEDSLRILTQGLAKFPQHAGLLYSQANVLFELGRLDAAEAALQRIVGGPDCSEHHVVPAHIGRKLAPRKLADVFRMQGKYGEAEQALYAVLQDFPKDTHAWYALGCVYGDTDQKEMLAAVIDRMSACPDGEIFAKTLRTAWHLRHRELVEARVLIDQLIGEIPHLPLPRLLRCQCLELDNAPLEARIAGWRDLLRVQPGNPDAANALQLLESARSLVGTLNAFDWCTSVVVNPVCP